MVLFAFFNGDDNRWRLNQILLVILLLQYQNNIWHRHYLLRLAVLPPQESPWKNLYKKADGTSFLHLTGLSQHAFVEGHGAALALRKATFIGSRGVCWTASFYLGSTMTYKHLCMIFGLTPTVCSCAINWMLKKTVWALWGHPLARVKFPTREKMREYASLVQL